MNTTTETKLELRRTFPVTRERIFAAWSDRDEMMQWFGPHTCKATLTEFDFRVGGRYSIQCKQEDGSGCLTSGVYREITPPSRIVYTWHHEDDEDWEGVTSLVTLEFHEQPGGTEMVLTHERFPSLESLGNHERGWSGTFDKLALYLASK